VRGFSHRTSTIALTINDLSDPIAVSSGGGKWMRKIQRLNPTPKLHDGPKKSEMGIGKTIPAEQ
jgi:hypothetical protein